MQLKQKAIKIWGLILVLITIISFLSIFYQEELKYFYDRVVYDKYSDLKIFEGIIVPTLPQKALLNLSEGSHVIVFETNEGEIRIKTNDTSPMLNFSFNGDSFHGRAIPIIDSELEPSMFCAFILLSGYNFPAHSSSNFHFRFPTNLTEYYREYLSSENVNESNSTNFGFMTIHNFGAKPSDFFKVKLCYSYVIPFNLEGFVREGDNCITIERDRLLPGSSYFGYFRTYGYETNPQIKTFVGERAKQISSINHINSLIILIPNCTLHVNEKYVMSDEEESLMI